MEKNIKNQTMINAVFISDIDFILSDIDYLDYDDSNRIVFKGGNQ